MNFKIFFTSLSIISLCNFADAFGDEFEPGTLDASLSRFFTSKSPTAPPLVNEVSGNLKPKKSVFGFLSSKKPAGAAPAPLEEPFVVQSVYSVGKGIFALQFGAKIENKLTSKDFTNFEEFSQKLGKDTKYDVIDFVKDQQKYRVVVSGIKNPNRFKTMMFMLAQTTEDVPERLSSVLKTNMETNYSSLSEILKEGESGNIIIVHNSAK